MSADADPLQAFHRDVLILVAELSYTGPCLPLKVELATRRRALSAFWSRWLPFSRVGYPTKDRLDELEFALREPLWLSRFSTVDQAVGHLCHAVRSRSKAIDHLPIMPELLPAAASDLVEEIYLAEQIAAIDDGPCRAYLLERLDGESWIGAADGDQAAADHHRYILQKKFSAYRPSQPKRVRERLKRR